jgi:pimeloyl-ACP methyl ester carboxylesterase
MTRSRTRSGVAILVIATALAGAAGCSGSTPSSGSTSSSGVADGTPSTDAPSEAFTPGTVVDESRPSGNLAFLGPVRLLPVNGITIGYRQFGDGPPLVMIVGQDSAMSYWGPDLPRLLARHFRVTIFDNRGVGASTDQPDQPLSIETMGDDTAELIAALGLDRPAVFGWSTGGEIALALAVRHPDLVGPLAVSGATAGGPATVPASPALDALTTSTALADQVKLLDALFTPSGAATRQRYIDGLLAMPEETVSPQIVERQAEAERRFLTTTEVADGLGSIRSPVLVTDGAEDQLVPVANARLVAAGIPGAQLLLVPDTSHAWMLQELDRFVTAMVGFVGGTYPTN